MHASQPDTQPARRAVTRFVDRTTNVCPTSAMPDSRSLPASDAEPAGSSFHTDGKPGWWIWPDRPAHASDNETCNGECTIAHVIVVATRRFAASDGAAR
jgi:hypothetical protein